MYRSTSLPDPPPTRPTEQRQCGCGWGREAASKRGSAASPPAYMSHTYGPGDCPAAPYSEFGDRQRRSTVIEGQVFRGAFPPGGVLRWGFGDLRKKIPTATEEEEVVVVGVYAPGHEASL
ncbi:hypothetical protein PLESTB_001753000 [Pleodorina starrii]|uniref:Uncharacterized protein n=1 Tax=Pleodorina starrii TaxID=330485 RepID=A0A9W6BZY8_9CHLO|nr:hypothetical protein PLESTM_000594900 [Pleodorina starrii]GLC61404.1 hypothetical protein PLESTB_001753000 [Pleodorina starrii]